jgi:UDP-N-acetylmuramoyl-L-alanine---L-glutamate ligase
MTIQELNGKSVCILGFGREGKAMFEALEKHVPEAKLTIADSNSQVLSPNSHVQMQLGPEYLKDLQRFDTIIKSPGIPPQKELESVKEKLTSSTQIFLESIRRTGAKVIGITGSKGKSTTASLIAEILKSAGKDVHLIGNIGKPAIAYVERANENTIFVQEMSSYQLMDLTISPEIAVVTSFFPEHLDYHGSMENYLEAKKHITRFQKKEDTVFFNEESEGAKAIADESTGTLVPFSTKNAPLRIEETKLIGTHNLGNIAAAFLVAKHIGISDDTSIAAIRDFQSLPHRLQPCGEHHGIKWIDDAISTTPESTIAAIDALDGNVTTLILGGQDRGNDFANLAVRIRQSEISTVILLGESGDRIRKALEDASTLVNIERAKSMKEVVQIAKEVSPSTKNPLVLLSPASPSYGLFKDFEERGNAFVGAILKS